MSATPPDTTSVVPVAPLVPTPAFDTAAVRELLVAAFSDGELTTLCFDYFRPVYEQFAEGMNRAQKTQILMEHCERQGLMEDLLAKIRRDNPHQYGKFKARLRNGNLLPDPMPDPNLPLNPSAGVTSVKDPTRSVGHKTERKRLRKLPMAAFIEADRKARSGETVVEKPEDPLEPPMGPIIDGPVTDGPVIRELEPNSESEPLIIEPVIEPPEMGLEQPESPSGPIIDEPVITEPEPPKETESPQVVEPEKAKGSMGIVLALLGVILFLAAFLVPMSSVAMQTVAIIVGMVLVVVGLAKVFP